MRPLRLLPIVCVVMALPASAAASKLSLKSNSESGRKLYSLTAVKASLADVVRLIAAESGRRIAIETGETKQITLVISDAT